MQLNTHSRSRDRAAQSLRRRKKRFIRFHGTAPQQRAHIAHRNKEFKKAVPGKQASMKSPLSVEQRIGSALHAHDVLALKKRLLKAGNHLLDRLWSLGYLEVPQGLELSLKRLKTQWKKSLTSHLSNLLEGGEELDHLDQEREELVATMGLWEEALWWLGEPKQEGELSRLVFSVHNLARSGAVYLEPEEGLGQVLYLDTELLFGEGPRRWRDEAIITGIDLLYNGVPEMKKVVVYPLIVNFLQIMGTKTSHVDLSRLDQVRLPNQERFVTRLIRSLEDIADHDGYDLIVKALDGVADESSLDVGRMHSMGPPVFSVLFQVLSGWNHLDELHLREACWIPGRAITDFISRHPMLKILDLSNCRPIKTESFEQIVSKITGLEEGYFAGLGRVDGALFEQLARANPQLRVLDISRCHQINERDLEGIAEQLAENGGELRWKSLAQIPKKQASRIVNRFLHEGLGARR